MKRGDWVQQQAWEGGRQSRLHCLLHSPSKTACPKAGCRLAEARGSHSPSSKHLSAWKQLTPNLGWKITTSQLIPNFPKVWGNSQHIKPACCLGPVAKTFAQDMSSSPVQAHAPSHPSFPAPSRWQMHGQPRDAAGAFWTFPAWAPFLTGLGSGVKSPLTPRGPSRATASLSGG